MNVDCLSGRAGGGTVLVVCSGKCRIPTRLWKGDGREVHCKRVNSSTVYTVGTRYPVSYLHTKENSAVMLSPAISPPLFTQEAHGSSVPYGVSIASALGIGCLYRLARGPECGAGCPVDRGMWAGGGQGHRQGYRQGPMIMYYCEIGW